MTMFERIRFSAAATVALVGVFMLIDMLIVMVFGIDWGDALFSPIFAASAYAVMFAAAPFISKFIKYK